MYRQMLSATQQESRAKNAVAEFLFRELIVPKVFFDAPWPNGRKRVDVLAVDRSGSGEIHAVEIMAGTNSLTRIRQAVDDLGDIPAHFKYLALFGNKNYRVDSRILYAPDGLGRVGVIQVKEDSDGDLSVEFSIRPERFGLNSSVFEMIDKFTAARYPNIEIRP